MHSACAVLYCHLWPAPLYLIFPHYLINGTIFGEMLLNIKCVCFDFVHKDCPKHLSFQDELSKKLSQMYVGIHVQYRLLLSDSNQT
jgi:hypothetical protein